MALRPRPEFQPLFVVSVDTADDFARSGDPDVGRGSISEQVYVTTSLPPDTVRRALADDSTRLPEAARLALPALA